MLCHSTAGYGAYYYLHVVSAIFSYLVGYGKNFVKGIGVGQSHLHSLYCSQAGCLAIDGHNILAGSIAQYHLYYLGIAYLQQSLFAYR